MGRRYADEIAFGKEVVSSEIYNGLKHRIEEHTAQKSDLLDFVFDSEDFEIQYIGLKKDINEFEEIFKKMKSDLEEEQRNERISERVTNLAPHQLDLIKTEHFKTRLRQEVPHIEFEVMQSGVNLFGTRDVLKRTRLYILEKISASVEDSFEISESKSRLFANHHMKNQVMELFRKADICASWLYIDKRVTVFALDYCTLKEAVEVLKNEVVETRLPLSALLLPKNFVRSFKWIQFTGVLCRQAVLMEIEANDSFIVVTSIKVILESFKGRIIDYLCLNTKVPKSKIWQLWQ